MSSPNHARFDEFCDVNDFAPSTVRALRNDFAKFAMWFERANAESYSDNRVTPRDIADFRRHLREDKRQAVATVNRCLVTLRRYFHFLARKNAIAENPAEGIKELRRVVGAPKAIDRASVRKMLREASTRHDHRAYAVLCILLYCGLRVGELVDLELSDLDLSDRSGSIRIRNGKGGKERTVPMPPEVRAAVRKYLEARPTSHSKKVLIGKGYAPLGTDGVRYIVRKYGLVAGLHLHPHQLRHTMATEYLAATENDLVGLAQILGHESIDTTSRYTKRSAAALEASVGRMSH